MSWLSTSYCCIPAVEILHDQAIGNRWKEFNSTQSAPESMSTKKYLTMVYQGNFWKISALGYWPRLFLYCILVGFSFSLPEACLCYVLWLDWLTRSCKFVSFRFILKPPLCHTIRSEFRIIGDNHTFAIKLARERPQSGISTIQVSLKLD